MMIDLIAFLIVFAFIVVLGFIFLKPPHNKWHTFDITAPVEKVKSYLEQPELLELWGGNFLYQAGDVTSVRSGESFQGTLSFDLSRFASEQPIIHWQSFKPDVNTAIAATDSSIAIDTPALLQNNSTVQPTADFLRHWVLTPISLQHMHFSIDTAAQSATQKICLQLLLDGLRLQCESSLAAMQFFQIDGVGNYEIAAGYWVCLPYQGAYSHLLDTYSRQKATLQTALHALQWDTQGDWGVDLVHADFAQNFVQARIGIAITAQDSIDNLRIKLREINPNLLVIAQKAQQAYTLTCKGIQNAVYIRERCWQVLGHNATLLAKQPSNKASYLKREYFLSVFGVRPAQSRFCLLME